MNVTQFTTTERRDQFFIELEALIDRYPELGNKMARRYADDPDDDVWTDPYGERFDPDAPVVLSAVALVLAHTSMQAWDTTTVLTPYSQTHATSYGVLQTAVDSW